MMRRTRKRPVVPALALLAAISAVRLGMPSGLRAQYFHGSDFAGAAAHSTLDHTFSAVELSRRWGFRPPDTFSAQWSGYLFVDTPGIYTFTVTADDNARLFIDRRAVIEAPGEGPGVRSGRLRLERGTHAVALQYIQRGGPYQLEWVWALEDGPANRVPAWALSPRARGGAAVFIVRWLGPVWWGVLGLCGVLGARLLVKTEYWSARRAGHGDGNVDSDDSEVGWRAAALGLALFALLAAVQTWPLVTDPGHLSRNDNADTLLNEWILAWFAHQLPQDPVRLFDANIFHPERFTLAYSEPLVVQSVLGAPLFWLGSSPVLVYNLVLLAGLALTGWATAFVVSRWTGDWTAGVASGMLVAFNAHTLTRLPHLQAQHAEFLPLALFALDSLLRRPRWSSAIWLAVWFALQALTSMYLLVFTAVALVVAFLVRPEDWAGDRMTSVVPRLSGAALLAGVVLIPFLLPYWRLNQAGFERSLDEVAWFAASVTDYWSTPSRLHGWLGTSSSGATSLFPGVTALGLASAAVVWHPRFADRRLRMCLAFGLVGVILSFGPAVPGYSSLYFATPLLQAVRGAARFGYLGLAAVAIVAGFGLAQVRRRLIDRPRLKLGASACLLILAFLEPMAAPITYQRFTPVPEIYRGVAQETNAVVAHLPFPPPEAIYRNAPYMLGSTLHFKPMLNGYSGFMPPSYVDHFLRLADFPSVQSVSALRELGVTHVFLHLDRIGTEAARAVAELSGLQRLAVEGAIELYRVTAVDESR
jgi:hypothetical protein